MKERVSHNGDRCADKIVPHSVLAQKFVFYSESESPQKFGTKGDKALEFLEAAQVSGECKGGGRWLQKRKQGGRTEKIQKKESEGKARMK